MHGKHVIIFLILLAGCTTEAAPIPAANINVRVQDDTPIVLPPVPRPASQPFDGIPPIYEPDFVSAAEAALIDDELIMGIAIDGKARAYPVTVLRFREIVNDDLGGVPLLVTW